jgi:hypothetical protein
MKTTRIAPLVGIAGCLGVLLALAYPYLVTDGGVGAYYGSGVVHPLVAGLLALVTIIVLAAGREERTDPGFASGIALVFGAAIVVLLLSWGMTARLDTVQISQYHRWVLAAVAVLIPAGSLGFARSLGVL